MKQLAINNQTIEFTIMNSEFYTTTLDVARVFNKQHYNILRIINQDIEFFTRLNIEASTYQDKTGKNNTFYYLSQGTFSLLVMGFRGKQAMQWKVEYIKAFELLKNEYYNSFKNLKDIIPHDVFEAIAPYAPYGEKSVVNGKPKMQVVRSYFRSINGNKENAKLVVKHTQHSLIKLDEIGTIETLGYKGGHNA